MTELVIATWSYREGCPELGLPPKEPFETRCLRCDASWTWGNFMGQVTGHWNTEGFRVTECESCGKEISTWTPEQRADYRMRIEAMIVRGYRHHGLTKREADMVRKKVDTALAVAAYTGSNEEPEKYRTDKQGVEKITPEWAKWDRERRQASEKKSARTKGALAKSHPDWENAGDIPIESAGEGKTYGVADPGPGVSGLPFAPWMKRNPVREFGEGSDVIAVEVVNRTFGLVVELIPSPVQRELPGWSKDQERAFAAFVLERATAMSPKKQYEAIWNPGQETQFTAPHNARTTREQYSEVAVMLGDDSAGHRLVAKKGVRTVKAVKAA